MLNLFNGDVCKNIIEQCDLISKLAAFIKTPEQALAHQAATESCNKAYNSVCLTSNYSSYCALAIPLAVIGYQLLQHRLNRHGPRR